MKPVPAARPVRVKADKVPAARQKKGKKDKEHTPARVLWKEGYKTRKAAADRERYLNNRAKLLEYQKNYYQIHKAERTAYHRRYHQEIKEGVRSVSRSRL